MLIFTGIQTQVTHTQNTLDVCELITTQLNAHTHIHTHAYTHMHTHACTHTCTHTHAHTCTNTHTPCLALSHLPTTRRLITTPMKRVGGDSRESPRQTGRSPFHLLHFSTVGEGEGGMQEKGDWEAVVHRLKRCCYKGQNY